MVTLELLCPVMFFLQFENACTFKLNIKNISCFLIGLSMVDVSLSWVFCFPYIGICGITVVVGWNRKSIQITLITPILKSLRRPSLPTISHQSIRMSSSPLPPNHMTCMQSPQDLPTHGFKICTDLRHDQKIPEHHICLNCIPTNGVFRYSAMKKLVDLYLL